MDKVRAHRFMELEGLRGVAAVMVAIYHNLLAFYALAFFGVGSINAPIQHMRFEDNFYGTPLSTLFSGTLAVAVFFILSGFVLSIGFFQTGKSEIVKKLAAKRYLRLMLPAVASILLCYVLIKLGFSHTQAAASITHSGWLAANWNFSPSIIQAIWGGMVTIFQVSGNPYNNVLWTMAFEFAGSFIVFGSLSLLGRNRYRWIGYIALCLFFFNTWFLGFVIGMVMADLYHSGVIRRSRRNIGAMVGLIGAMLLFGGYPMGDTAGTIYHYINNILPSGLNSMMLFTIISATLAVFIVLWSSQAGTILEKKYVSAMGKYTFSLYLVHLAVLYSFTTGIFLIFIQHTSYNKAALLSMVLSIPLVYFATVVFERYIDKPSIKLASQVAAVFLGDKQLNPAILKKWTTVQQRTGFLRRAMSLKKFSSRRLEDGDSAPLQ